MSGLPVLHHFSSLPKFMSFELVMPSSHLISSSVALFSFCLQSFLPSGFFLMSESQTPYLSLPLVLLPGNHKFRIFYFEDSSGQFSSVAQSCPTLCDPMNLSTPGLPVHHQLPEFTQTHAHRVGDAIQPSHPLSSPSPPAPNPSQHQGLFQ